MPDEDSIGQMLASAIGDVPCTADIDIIKKQLVGYTCADIVAIANKAKTVYVKRSIGGDDRPLDNSDFAEIIRQSKPSISSEEAAQYERQRAMESLL